MAMPAMSKECYIWLQTALSGMEFYASTTYMSK